MKFPPFLHSHLRLTLLGTPPNRVFHADNPAEKDPRPNRLPLSDNTPQKTEILIKLRRLNTQANRFKPIDRP